MRQRKSSYPKVTLWNTKVAPEDRLTIINEKDFPREAILKGLGIPDSPVSKSFGIRDPEEIQDRLALSDFLLRNHKLRRRIKDISRSSIPIDGSNFMAYFHKDILHNRHWSQVHSFLTGIQRTKAPLPRRLVKMVDILRGRNDLEALERKLGTEASDLLGRSTVVEGQVTLEMPRHSGNVVSSIAGNDDEMKKVCCIHGHRHHSISLSRLKARDYPEWDGWNEMKTLGLWWLTKAAFALGVGLYRKHSMRTMTIKTLDKPVMQELEATVNGILHRIDMFRMIEALPRHVSKLYIDIYFSYSEKGLQIRIDAIRPETSDEETDEDLQYAEYGGYSSRRIARIERLQKRINQHRREASRYLLAGMLYDRLTHKDESFFDIKNFNSPKMDEEFRWVEVTPVIRAGDFRDRFEKINEHRDFFYGHLETLKTLCEILESMKKKARKCKTKLCIPEILTGQKQTMLMNEIYPIHLLDRSDVTPLPIRGVSEVNGEMVCVTGENASGKTVFELALTDNVWLAQSGLPIFGKRFALTLKKALGLVFVERGDGSTCELLMRKIKNLLEYLEENGGEDVLFILDEIGTGTSEVDFVALGQRILDKLHASNVSVICSTQIRALAEYAEKTLGTRCLKLDRLTRTVSPGIGDANPQGLAEAVGLSDYLGISEN